MRTKHGIKIYIKSDSETNGIDLRFLVLATSGLHSLLDRSYAHMSGNKRLSKRDRNEFQILAQNFRPGSLHIDAQIITDIAQAALPLTAQIRHHKYLRLQPMRILF